MFPDLDDQGPGPDPGAGGCVRIKIVDRSAAGVHTVQRVLGGPVGGLTYGLVKLAVHHAGKGVSLVDHAGEGVGEGGVFDAVENDRTNRHLAVVGLAPGLSGDDPGQQIQVAV